MHSGMVAPEAGQEPKHCIIQSGSRGVPMLTAVPLQAPIDCRDTTGGAPTRMATMTRLAVVNDRTMVVPLFDFNEAPSPECA